jgi:hypothetical protein
MRTSIAALLAAAALVGCKKTGDNSYEFQTPHISLSTDTHTVKTPEVSIGTRKDTINTPTMGTQKETLIVNKPFVGTKKTEVSTPVLKVKRP